LTCGTFDLYWIAVDPACRGRGIGRDLLVQVEAEVRARDGRLLVVETSSTSPYAAARGFYVACGYYHEATVRDFYAPGDDLIVFRKELSAGNVAPGSAGGASAAVSPKESKLRGG
jgi:ribosomal protein S18 acetylase RimI-like enzyme